MFIFHLLLDLHRLTDVKSEVFDVASKWRYFGEALHINPATLDRFGGDAVNCLTSTLTEFLKKNYDTNKYGVPSWKLIVAAVGYKEGGNNRNLALTIAKNHPSTKGIFITYTIYIDKQCLKVQGTCKCTCIAYGANYHMLSVPAGVTWRRNSSLPYTTT